MTKAQSEHLAGDLVAFKAGANNLDRYFLSHGVVIEVEGMVNESYYYGGATGEYWYYSVLTFAGKVLRVREDNLQKYSNRLNKFRSGSNSGYGDLARERIEASRPLVAAQQAMIKAAHTQMTARVRITIIK